MSHGLNRSVFSIDVGTSGVRAGLFDEQGNQIDGAQAVRRREVTDFAELDPDELVEEVVKTVDDVLGQSVQDAGPFEAIAISAFWHSLMGV
ncbi:MAG TPA: FGGY family carbohydrate kinase, partial [Pyrinomonadaceae bacterium]